MTQQSLELALQRLSNPKWRINNLYHIVDKQGRKIKFNLNWAQEDLYNNMWYCNVVLKARQLGISTFICLLFLDRCLFNSNQSAGIIAHTLEDAQQLFRRVKFAYDNLPPQLIDKIKADSDTAQMLKFSNGSSLRVGTSLRSSTFQYLHISEFGNICAKYPDKANEIITGSLNTVAPGQYIFIESTAEGKDGYFYEICKRAERTKESDLSKIDFKFHFFPWWKEPGYRIGSNIRIDDDLSNYFDHLKNVGINLDEEQRAWYASRYAIQNEDMWREYPSTAEESWQVSNEGFYYGKQLTVAKVEGRIGRVPYDDKLLVSTAWDLGGATATSDYTSIWFFQVYGKEIRIIDYLEGHNSLQEWIGLVLKKDYCYDTHLAPHDISVTEMSNGISRINTARKMGIRMLPVKKSFIIEGIDEVRNILSRCWFDEKKCEKGINALENYKKQWDERLGTWENRPLHNWASHGADAMRTLATGLHYVVNKNQVDRHNPAQYMKNRFGT